MTGIGTRATDTAMTRPLRIAPAWAPTRNASAVPARARATTADFVAMLLLRIFSTSIAVVKSEEGQARTPWPRSRSLRPPSPSGTGELSQRSFSSRDIGFYVARGWSLPGIGRLRDRSAYVSTHRTFPCMGNELWYRRETRGHRVNIRPARGTRALEQQPCALHTCASRPRFRAALTREGGAKARSTTWEERARLRKHGQ